MTRRTASVLPLASGAALLASGTATAQLEEIIVTTQRREQTLQDVPISVAAYSGVTLQEGGFSDMEDFSAFVPNLHMADTFVSQRLAIRGIGTGVANEAFEQAVAQFHDGVYYGRDNMGQNSFFDLERIEVVRGPQPTFAGQSATAGALNVISRRPGEQLGGNAVLAYGTDEEATLELAYGGPVGESFGFRAAGRYYKLDDTGYRDLVTGDPLGIKENKAFRLTGVWEPTDTFALTLKYEHHDVWQEGTPVEFVRCEMRPALSSAHPAVTPGMPALCAADAAYNGLNVNELDGARGSRGSVDIWDALDALNAASGAQPGDPDYWGNPASPVARGLNEVWEYNQREERQHDADVFLASFDWQIGDLTLSSITSLVQYDKTDWLDPDDSSFAIFTDWRAEEFEQTAQELRLTSPADQTFAWMVGLYWQTHDLDTTIDVFLPWLFFGADPAWNGVYRARSFGGTLVEESTWNALFFAGTWNISESFRLNVGGRYQDIQKDGTLYPTQALLGVADTRYGPRFPLAAPVSGNADADDTLPEIGLQWNASDNTMLYVKYAEALKAGGFVMSPPVGGALPNPFVFLPEYAEGYELGLKTRLLDGTLDFNVALYDTDYTDLQVSVFVTQIGQFITTNAARAHTTGIEFDGRWAANDRFTLGFSGSIGEAEYDEYSGAPCNTLDDKLWAAAGNGPPGSCRLDLAGAQLIQAPDWTVSLYPQFRFGLGANLRGTLGANVTLSDGYVSSDNRDPLARFGSWQRVDFRFAVAPERGNWEVALYGRDVTDERPAATGPGDFQSKSRDQTVYDAGSIGRERGARYGVQLNYFFGS
jgi:iron complex outermembrane recepter protein